MNENKEHTVASAELREMISHAMVTSQNGEAPDELKERISKAMEKKEQTASKQLDELPPDKPLRRSSSGKSEKTVSEKPAEKKTEPRKSVESRGKSRKRSGKRFGKTANLRGGWSIRKKTGVTLGFIFLALVLVMAVGVLLFFHYTGLLKDRDNTIRMDAPPVDSRDLVDEDDTLDEEAKEKELREMLEKKSKKISNKNVMNVLLIGEDIRDTATQDRGNTDVMMLISINKEKKTITLTSIMRDTWVYMEKFNVSAKLNQAYWHGGAEYLAEVIEDYFSISIDRTVKVNFKQFIDIVETVGGLDFDVSYTEAVAMRDPMDEQNHYLGNKKGTDYIDLEQYGKDESVNYYDVEGKFNTTIEYQSEEDNSLSLHLNGNQSLAYARVRYGCGDDYGRTMRQRETIKEIVTKAKTLSLVQLDELMNIVLPEVETDLEEGEIADMLLNAFDYMNYDIQQMRVPADGYYTMDVIWSQSCLSLRTWQFQANAAFLRYIIYGDCKNVDEAIEQYQQEIDDGTFYEKNEFDPPVIW
ncbi:LCP family protein [Ruminococcus sp.]|uniref:LCP family protein n=1 Tax=Ruminococcus sp. TaxID=41978 RepID=UPI0025DE5503|nr:LCP family protein [Ruminococcus sp.]MBQ8966584.1 LCP family protein [Ruminococcus sp.]